LPPLKTAAELASLNARAAGLRKRYDAACGVALERYHPDRKTDAWRTACDEANTLWRQLRVAREEARAAHEKTAR